MNFVMYIPGGLDIEAGAVLYVDKDVTDGFVYDIVNPFQEDAVVYLYVTEVAENGSMAGVVLNATLDYNEPTLMSNQHPYTAEGVTNFMWENRAYRVGPHTSEDLMKRYPEWFL